MMPAKFNLEIFKGATFGPIKITCKNSAGDVVDLTSHSVYADVCLSAGNPVVFSLVPAITDAENGEITIRYQLN